MPHLVRLATVDDLEPVLALAASTFPADDPGIDAPVDGELLEATAAGAVLVAEASGAVVGMLRMERIGADHTRLGLLAVEPGFRRRGIARELLREAVSVVAGDPENGPVTAVVDAGNVAAVALLASEGMLPHRGIRNYAGEGRDRLYCQLVDRERVTVDDTHRVLVPPAATGYLFDVLEGEDHVITAVLDTARGAVFEVSTVGLEDEHSLKIDEAAVGVSEAGSIAAGLTFLLGISFTVPAYSESLRVLLLFATILTAGALQVFSSASTAGSRSRNDRFGAHMRWANALLEFGGVYPLVIVLPSVFDQASPNETVSTVVSVLATIALIAYEYSPFSLMAQSKRTILTHVLGAITVLLPLAAAPLNAATGTFEAWVALVGAVMIARIATVVLGNGSTHSARRRAVAKRRRRVR
jgi:ribosomal protein S18 acetylase RimI-like enzyme